MKQLLAEKVVTLSVVDVVQSERVHAVDIMMSNGEYCCAALPNMGGVRSGTPLGLAGRLLTDSLDF